MNIPKGGEIFKRIHAKQATVTIIGGGYVGLPLAVRCAKVGHDVKVCDVDGRKVDSINKGESYIGDVPSSELLAALPRLRATTNPREAIAAADIVVDRKSVV